MSESLELSLDTQCYLCDLLFTHSNEPYILYKCFCCMKFTPYCFSCELKIQRLFGRGNLFKCTYCNKLTNAIDKIEINPQNIQKNVNPISNSLSTKNSSYFKTPIKSLIESNSLLNNIKLNKINNYNSKNEEERKDNNNSIISSDNSVISNFIKEFSLFDLANNSKNINMTKIRNPEINNNMVNNSLTIIRDNNTNNYTNLGNRNRTLTNSNSVSDFRKINDYSLLKDRKRINRKLCGNNFLGKKRDESDKSLDLRGKSKDKICSINNGNNKTKKIITKNMSRLYRNGDSGIDGSSLTRGKLGLYTAINNSRTDYFDFKNNMMKYNGGLGIPMGPMGNNFNISSNLFPNQNWIVGIGLNNNISGTATPHKFNTNNDEQYF